MIFRRIWRDEGAKRTVWLKNDVSKSNICPVPRFCAPTRYFRRQKSIHHLKINNMKENDQPKPTNHSFPPIELLERIDNEQPCVSSEEIERNKKWITEVLKHFEIPFTEIAVQCGLAYSSYNITLAPPARPTEIFELEDDFELLLRYLGRNRITIPLPWKIAFGIEIVNGNPQTLSLRSLIETEAFQNSEAELPIALGVTIDGKPAIADLRTMPNLLMAGATGQGKSVCLNAIIVSLLFKKRPTELKFILVDPKRVELSLYNTIGRHYLAKLPDSEEAIVSDVEKAVRTLNSLREEMDTRYDLLRKAQVRNIKEYNTKYFSRQLNPEHGHRYMPYIVVVIDEFADLMMTAGCEVEQPIVQIAQIASAVGIHLIIATQRPTESIITGAIKANFPSRIAFRVCTSVESRTLLDQGGAESLNGNGDMLFSHNGELLRLQGALVQPEEIERVVNFIENTY